MLSRANAGLADLFALQRSALSLSPEEDELFDGLSVAG
jgi:hypothetical protein